ncbi:hypothetical protein B0H14DRAFT_3096150 [Mycena olivaceomarginata]|nr:hypothetical protein B0H14DRAFT_3096150 [Mycena olivaceomarginata]
MSSPESALHKRKRYAFRIRSPPPKTLEVPKVIDVDPIRRAERERQLAARVAAMELEKTDKPKTRSLTPKPSLPSSWARARVACTCHRRVRALQAAASSDKASPEYQRLSWDALRKSITGIVNRVNIVNIKAVVPELFAENLIRGRGLFARSVMKAQRPLPQVGELIFVRLVSQFRRAFKRNDKIVCHSTTTFIAHLVNQAVAHEIIALQIMVLLIERPTDDSIEIAVGFMREVGAFLAENSPKANATVFERFRAYMIEVLMQVRKDKYKDNPILAEGLDLVEEEEQITHQIQLEEELQVQEGLSGSPALVMFATADMLADIFKFDPNYLENEEKYKAIKQEILGEDEDEESGSEESSDEEDEDEVAAKEGIEDRTETNLVNLQAVHKLLKVQLQEGQEIELVNMIIECCSQERSYSTFYGLVGERFSKLNRVWTDCFEQAFGNYYTTIHRYETNRLRNIARFFGHLLASDAISWLVLECVKINEDDTTSSSRIFVKIMMTEMTEAMGLKTVAERFRDPEVRRGCEGMFPVDVPKNTRFAINYFTSIGMGAVTEEMREYLKNAPKLIMEQRRAMLDAESSDSSSSDSDSDSSDSDSDSDSSASSRGARRRRSRTRSRTPPRRRSVSPRRREPSPVRRGGGRSEARPRRARGGTTRAPDSRSPPPRHRDSRSRSPPPPPPARRRFESPPKRGGNESPPRRGEWQRRTRARAERPPHIGGRRLSRSPSPKRRRADSRERSPPPPPRERRRDSRERDRGYERRR